MTTRLIFIRHAQSLWNEIGRWQGHANPPLGENGRAQAHLLARRLSTWQIDHLYCSDLERAMNTATILGESLGLTPTIDPLWRERGIGVLEGLTTEEIELRYPEAWASRLTGPMVGIEGAEATEEVLKRAEMACRALLQRHHGQSVAVVSHGGMILTTLVHLLQLPAVGFARLTGGYHTAISQVVIDEDHARLVGLNDAAHLELLGEKS